MKKRYSYFISYLKITGRKLSLFAILLILATAQQLPVSAKTPLNQQAKPDTPVNGKITDAAGIPLIGASIGLKMA